MSFWNKKITKFKSEHGWFEMELPKNWAQYEDEPGTYAFFDLKEWKGNFRITPLQVDKTTQGKRLFENYLEKGGLETKIGKFNCIFLKELPEEENSIIYSWLFNTQQFVFISTYTCKRDDDTKMIRTELEKVSEIIKSIKIL